MSEFPSQSDREFLAELHQQGDATIAEMCDKLDVTTTAVRQRVQRLQSGGWLVREAIKQERGRPQHRYRLTGEAKKLLGENYSDLASILWEQLKNIEDEAIRKLLAEKIKQALIDRYGAEVNGVEPGLRLKQLQAALQENGFHVEIDKETNHLALKERTCPYHDLAEVDHSICDLEQDVFGAIVGVPLQLTQRCVDGHNCCRFEEVTEENKK